MCVMVRPWPIYVVSKGNSIERNLNWGNSFWQPNGSKDDHLYFSFSSFRRQSFRAIKNAPKCYFLISNALANISRHFYVVVYDCTPYAAAFVTLIHICWCNFCTIFIGRHPHAASLWRIRASGILSVFSIVNLTFYSIFFYDNHSHRYGRIDDVRRFK